MAVEKGDTGSKMSIIRIVQVLLRESDKDHPLSQQEILDYMEGKYGMEVCGKKSHKASGCRASCVLPRSAAHDEREEGASLS